MTILECKICGGCVVPTEDKTYGTCDSCGRIVTLPKTDDEHKAGLFNRGNTFRMRGEFDKAAAVFERIIEQDEKDAEAHWCLALCRYGIEYVEDPKSGERKPTLHRMSYDLFINDVDCQAAIEHSDEYTAGLYREEAERITEIQKKVLAISNKEEPYDIFICYKEKTEDGSRTKESVIAQDIYYELTNAGYRVFFARITLEDKLGIEYEPYIFAALNSSKVMVVVGTSPENFNAVWVRNEWKRFLTLMKNDRSRVLIPCYRDMDPYDLPDELAMLQAQDMSKIGFMQDLVRGIKKVLDAKAAKTPEKVVPDVLTSSLDRLIQNSDTYLKLKNYPAAEEAFERITREYPEDYRGWWGLILCKTREFTEVVDDDAVRQLNTWLSYVRQLAKPDEFETLRTRYIEYLSAVANNDANNEVARIHRTISSLKSRVSSLNAEIERIEQTKARRSEKFEEQLAADDQAINNARIGVYDSKSDKFKYLFKMRSSLAVIIIGFILVIWGYNRDVDGFLLGIGVIILGIYLVARVRKKSIFKKADYIDSVEGANIILQKAIQAKEDNIKQYNADMENLDSQIACQNEAIKKTELKISDWNNYLAVGREKMAEMFFAKRCESVGIEQQFDITVEQLRNEALKGS